jgi:large subunit ribosomal protein L11
MPTIKLLVEGGSMAPGPAVAQQIGPMGINMGKVISDVNEKTKEFKGMNVPVILEVNATTKEYTIEVSSPPTSELIKKELGLELASGERKKNIVANMAIEQAISVTKQKQENMLAKNFVAALRSVIGTCMALGIIIESRDPKDISNGIANGEFKEEIDSQKTDVSPEKKAKLDSYLSNLQARQQKVKAEEAKLAEEKAEAKAEAVAAEAGESAEAKPEETTTEGEAKPAEKAEEKA